MKKKFLLVSEGPTDHVIIKEVAKTISSATGKEIEVIELSPQRDATSGTYPGHGWNGIQSWCKKFSLKTPESLSHLPPTAQQYLMRQNWRALLAFDSADGLIIQLDTDIAEQLTELKNIQPGECRKTHCSESVLSWLNESAISTELYLALTSHSIETWILATHPPTADIFKDLPANFNYEEITDVEDRLLSLGYASKFKRGRNRVRKTPHDIYIPYAKSISENMSAVRQRCESADNLCKHFES